MSMSRLAILIEYVSCVQDRHSWVYKSSNLCYKNVIERHNLEIMAKMSYGLLSVDTMCSSWS